jgi:hypothetical protein
MKQKIDSIFKDQLKSIIFFALVTTKFNFEVNKIKKNF